MIKSGLILLMWTVSVALHGCSKKQVFKSPDDQSADVTTAATPNGGRVKAAEDGPERSALGEPKFDLNSFQLSVTGLVEHNLSLTWEDIQQWPSVYTDTMLMYCVEGWEVWGQWKGILVKELLDAASLRQYAKHIMFHGLEGYTTALPIAYLEKYDGLLAYEVNGKPLKEHDGFPLRLIAFGKFGYKWAKWVTKLEVIEEPQFGYWERYDYSDWADVPMSRRRRYEGPEARPLSF